jgi:hypothetical protein
LLLDRGSERAELFLKDLEAARDADKAALAGVSGELGSKFTTFPKQLSSRRTLLIALRGRITSLKNGVRGLLECRTQ